MKVKTIAALLCVVTATHAYGYIHAKRRNISHWVNPLARFSQADLRSTNNPTGPLISARSGIIIDAESGKVLWSKNPYEHVFPASTTKIMTALLLMENFRPNQVLTAPKGIEKVGGSSLHLRSGEKITARNLLYALMLRSANDGCVTVAYNLAGSVPAFVKMMNAKARELGCTHIHFDNPNGLPDPKHWVTAHDMAMIARHDMRIPIFREVVKTVHFHVSRSIDKKDESLTNTDRWLQYDPTADGIKTGWTVAAGHCFIGSATRDGFRVIDVEYHSANWIQDNKRMLAWAFAHFDHKPVTVPSTVKLTARIPNLGSIPCELAGPVTVIHGRGKPVPTYLFQVAPVLVGTQNVIAGEKMSELRIYNQNHQLVGEEPLLASKSVTAQLGDGAKPHHPPIIPATIAGGLVLCGMIYVKTSRKRSVSQYWRSSSRL